MAERIAFKTQRLDNLTRNSALFQDLGIATQAKHVESTPAQEPPKKKHKAGKHTSKPPPSRASARLATSSRPIYNEDILTLSNDPSPKAIKSKSTSRTPTSETIKPEPDTIPTQDLEELQSSWSQWTSTAPPPTRDDFGTFHFPSHPIFLPNKSPLEVLSEGAFGGSYFRPLYSKTLNLTISNDYQELPTSWTSSFSISTYLTNPDYDPEINKFHVKCGQSIEEWEASGWINHDYDVRGWFQWYCRYFQGRRCEDDERQIGRWKNCVGERGRWRRMLLKKYRKEGVKEVADDGEDEDQGEVSPVMHQTCHHWAWCVTQDVLDQFWREG